MLRHVCSAGLFPHVDHALEAPLLLLPSLETYPLPHQSFFVAVSTDMDVTSPKNSTEEKFDHSSVWFEDGNIIIQAESAQFRVYRGILAMNSSVLRGMFELAQPDESDMQDGCPVVHFYDSAQDVRHFLCALHFPRYYHPSETTSWNIVAAMLRLGKKYAVHHLHESAFKQISALYPIKFADWCSRPMHSIQQFIARPLAVYQLAKETGHLSLLPGCLYSMTTVHRGEDIIHGITLPDGSHAELEPHEKLLILQNRAKFTAYLRESVLGFLFKSPPSCQSSKMCSLVKYATLQKLHADNSLDLPGRGTGLFGVEIAWESIGFCAPCYAAAFVQWKNAREDFWNNLPQMFNLPSWKEIEKSLDVPPSRSMQTGCCGRAAVRPRRLGFGAGPTT
ncbi:hypothetical protein EDD85DRAFT_639463 [Armillaria nabsnona]|nr:hypothetical protein EDD85DRAFT_639463 [Armillaria nabsnona]